MKTLSKFRTTPAIIIAIAIFSGALPEEARGDGHRFPGHRVSAVGKVYKTMPADSGCMNALYVGIAAIYDWPESQRIAFRAKVIAYAKRVKKDNSVDRIMEALEKDGLADAKTTIAHVGGQDDGDYATSLEAAILARAKTDGGVHFFVLGVNEGFHSVLLAVLPNDTGGHDVFWLDQFTEGFSDDNNVTGKLDRMVANEKYKSPRYGWGDIRYVHLKPKL